MDTVNGLEIDSILILTAVILVFYSLINPVIKNKYFSAEKSSLLKQSAQIAIAVFIAYIGAFIHYNPVDIQEIEVSFIDPIYNGNRPDNCLYADGKKCGREAATEWCKSQGYHAGLDWRVSNIRAVGGTSQRIGDQFVCAVNSDCTAFVYIKCSK